MMRAVWPILKTLATVATVAILLLAIQALWTRFQVEPLTRDGKVRADVIPIAADVGGLLTEVRVHDNQRVHRGQILLVVDRPRYELALQQAQAVLGDKRIALAQAEQEDRRNQGMSELIARETIEEGHAKAGQLRMAVQQATANRDLAQLNLERTYVRAPVDGLVTNMTLQPGVYLNAGKPAVALVYSKSLRVEGYFEETKLPAIHLGDPARVRLMGVDAEIPGHVESIASGVEDRERGPSENLLANVNPSFTWVRLAQRIPVRIVIDRLPPGLLLVPGQTASVEILPRKGDPIPRRSFPW